MKTAILSLGFLFLAPALVCAESGEAILTAVHGDVRISTAAHAPLIAAVKGMKCSVGATIRTGLTGSAELIYDDGTALRVDKNSALTIQNASFSNSVRTFLIQLYQGRLLNTLTGKNNRGPAKFSVRTPVCVASVRGTVFVTDCSSTTADVAVFEGSVAASADEKSAPVEIPANKQSNVKYGQQPSKPTDLSAEFEEYRKTVAELFTKQTEYYRQNMEEVRKMNVEYMENWRQGVQQEMDDYRKQFNQRNPPSTGEPPPDDMQKEIQDMEKESFPE
ncbi:MAG TPA: FecR family protein [Elusimicrobiota bacterium]|nr:FecR family protein [Elusimicrobiota bacterium]